MLRNNVPTILPAMGTSLPGSMQNERIMNKIEKSSGNVHADAEEMLVKATLSVKIAEIIWLQKVTQTQAAEAPGMRRPKPSNRLRGQFRGISEAKSEVTV